MIPRNPKARDYESEPSEYFDKWEGRFSTLNEICKKDPQAMAQLKALRVSFDACRKSSYSMEAEYPLSNKMAPFEALADKPEYKPMFNALAVRDAAVDCAKKCNEMDSSNYLSPKDKTKLGAELQSAIDKNDMKKQEELVKKFQSTDLQNLKTKSEHGVSQDPSRHKVNSGPTSLLAMFMDKFKKEEKPKVEEKTDDRDRSRLHR